MNKYIPPAKLNTQIKKKSYENALKAFQENHQTANKEFLVQVDSDGFVHAYNRGGAHAVSMTDIAGKVKKGSMLIHNHPSGGNFSDLDLINMSRSKEASGIVATGSKGATFTIVKGTHFKAEEFARAVSVTKMHGLDYTHALDNFLRSHQKKYGYKYSTEGYKSPSRTSRKKTGY